MNTRLGMLLSAGLGALFMYVFDPDRGRRRRAIARDKMVHAGHTTLDGIGVAARDAGNRAWGFLATARSMVFGSEIPSDPVLEDRVRSRLGRLATHPSAIGVLADNGVVTLSGPVLAHEVDRLLRGVRRVQGVREVDNQLEVHAEAGNVPGLQGEGVRKGRRFEFMQENWSPAARLVAGLAGGAISYYGFSRRNLLGSAMGAAGLGLASRAATNMQFGRLLGLRGRRGIDIRKTIHIHAPVDKVFQTWANFENFPKFMRNVQDVSRLDDKRWRWTVAGPAGAPIEWDAVVTAQVPNAVLAWRTEDSALVRHAGIVRFRWDARKNSTLIDVNLTYNPIGGGAGHLLASLFGANPKRELDEDIMRMKTFIETGVPPRDAAQRSA